MNAEVILEDADDGCLTNIDVGTAPEDGLANLDESLYAGGSAGCARIEVTGDAAVNLGVVHSSAC